MTSLIYSFSVLYCSNSWHLLYTQHYHNVLQLCDFSPTTKWARKNKWKMCVTLNYHWQNQKYETFVCLDIYGTFWCVILEESVFSCFLISYSQFFW